MTAIPSTSREIEPASLRAARYWDDGARVRNFSTPATQVRAYLEPTAVAAPNEHEFSSEA